MSFSPSRTCAVRRRAPSPRPRRSSARPRHQDCGTALCLSCCIRNDRVSGAGRVRVRGGASEESRLLVARAAPRRAAVPVDGRHEWPPIKLRMASGSAAAAAARQFQITNGTFISTSRSTRRARFLMITIIDGHQGYLPTYIQRRVWGRHWGRLPCTYLFQRPCCGQQTPYPAGAQTQATTHACRVGYGAHTKHAHGGSTHTQRHWQHALDTRRHWQHTHTGAAHAHGGTARTRSTASEKGQLAHTGQR